MVHGLSSSSLQAPHLTKFWYGASPQEQDEARFNTMKKREFSRAIGRETLRISLPGLAEHASGEALVQYGGTVVLATVVMNPRVLEGKDFFPLVVEYEERFYAAGEIRSSRFMKREARPSDEATISARLIDRTIRPRFEKGLRNEVQVIVTILSFDHENDPDIPGMIATSVALSTSPIPWNGPIAGVRVGNIKGELVLNPTMQERARASLDVVAAGMRGEVNMLEAAANEVPEEDFLEAVKKAMPVISDLVSLQEEIIQTVAPTKLSLAPPLNDPAIKQAFTAFIGRDLEKALFRAASAKKERMDAVHELKERFLEHIGQRFQDTGKIKEAMEFFEEEINRVVHKKVLEEERRPDARKLSELRSLQCDVAYLPRTHGSGLFARGSTRAIAILTLGPPGRVQTIEMMEGEAQKRFMLHYNFPPYSVGDTKPLRGPSRRDIGHGMLAEKALVPLMPTKEAFPYAIRIVSEILSSNGSSSMASVCAASLALMDGGVPIRAPAAGIAVGLMTDEGGGYKILTDIQGPEDHHGDMDLKVAGTRSGVTAVQMDVKISGITVKILKEALEQARKARLEILGEMEKVIAAPREDLSPYAPRVYSIQIPPEKIREVIGPGGKVINAIIAETGAEIDIEDSGLVFVTAKAADAAAKAIAWIKNITREIKPGELFDGRVTRLFPFGAMVEIIPGQEGLLHISELSESRGSRTEDLVEIGEKLMVEVREIDGQGRINLRLAQERKKNVPQDRPPRRPSFGGSGGGGRPRPYH